jgi:hypothetical protein
MHPTPRQRLSHAACLGARVIASVMPLLAEQSLTLWRACFSRQKTVARGVRGVVKFTGPRRRLRLMSVARSAFHCSCVAA